jgi:hypothetical protein
MARRARIVVNEAEEEGDQNQGVNNAPNDDETESDAASADRVDAEYNAALHEKHEPVTSGFSVVDRTSEPTFGTIEVVEAPKRGRAARTARVPKATPNQVATVAPPLIVGLMNQAVVAWMGPECAMLQVEANFMTPSISRIIARLPPAAAQAVSLYTDPFVVIGTMALWTARIAKIKDQQAKQKYQIAPFEAARAYGESGTELRTDVPPVSNPSEPPIEQSNESKNGQARAATDAIFRTVSPT